MQKTIKNDINFTIPNGAATQAAIKINNKILD